MLRIPACVSVLSDKCERLGLDATHTCVDLEFRDRDHVTGYIQNCQLTRCVPCAQGVAPLPASLADANHNGIPDGYEFAQTADFYPHHEWRLRRVPMAAVLGISTDAFHPGESKQVTCYAFAQGVSSGCDRARQ